MASQERGPNRVSIIARKIFVDPIHDTIGFFKEYNHVFGTLFVVLIGLTYFFQGFRAYTGDDGVDWYLRQAGATSAAITAASANINIPFTVKFLWGLLFDNIPIFRRNYQPWYFISAAIGVGAFLVLGLPNISLSESATTAVLFLAILSQAMTDVVADGMVVKNAREAGAKGGAGLQTYSWILYFIGSLIGTPVAGAINGPTGAGSRNLMLYLFTPCSIILVVVSLLMKEKPDAKPLTPMNIVKMLWKLIKGVLFNLKVLLPMTFIVIRGIIVPGIASPWRFWLQQERGIGADQQGAVGAISSVAAILGLFAFARWFTQTPFRTIFFWAQIISGSLGFLDIALYKGWNRSIGIPDLVFYTISESLDSAIGRIYSMPFLVMAAQLCPQSIEATFYATLTSLSNAGGTASRTWSAEFLKALKVDGRDSAGKRIINVAQFETALWIRIGMTFAPILFLWMVPNVSAINAHSEDPAEDEMTTAERDALEEAAAAGDDLAAVELKKQDEKIEAEKTVVGH
ncbi:hypothetical protein HDV05_006111 [Chytridiales sp. JEL 0842]|nr:hypothetical protein HDV05_006111 [Chytridiales sp. JEL 0842]